MGWPKGKPLPVETRAKMSAALKKNWKDPVYFEKMCACRKGRIHSPEAIKKMCVVQKGHSPSHSVPVGTRTKVGNYTVIKIAEPNVWESEHRAVYIATYGFIPEKHDVHHIDGNIQNNAIENLLAISHSEHGRIHFPKGKRSNYNYGGGSTHPE